ncbi:DUF302 domain-containing protein [uncultured Croceitalea sp.]|uniref:DUF302 domain-containing protein n=1 Tax=uncultured Croceitalea sp. TaxID=1798908 RepID=UPI00374EE346
MKYYHEKKLKNLSFDTAIEKTIATLKAEGFGIISEIDITSIMKQKLNIDFHNYKILGACSPDFAYKALQAEDKIGTLLPCNVIVQEKESGMVEVAAIDPMASMQSVINMKILNVAEDVSHKLEKAINSL